MQPARRTAATRRSAAAAPSRPRRRGGVYVAVLGVALIVSLIAMSALHLSRAETDVLTGAQQMAQAEMLSQSAVDLALARMMADASWRSNYQSGALEPPSEWISLGAGGMKFAFVDADGNLQDDARDIVTVRGIGRLGEATQVTEVQAEPATAACGCLGVSMHIGGYVIVSGATVTVDRTLSTNSSIAVSNGTIEGDAWAVNSITGTGTVTGTTTQNGGARGLPNEDDLWAYYLANGTKIDIASIPSQTIDKVVLSAANNPYGAENPQGIYIIDTQGQTLRIRDSRIVATLVIISPTAPTEVESFINWTSPATNFPALLVHGNLTMEWSGGSSLVESAAGVNFNPAGAPYENVADADQTDSYPGLIKGVVYCRGNLSVTSPCVVQGVLVATGMASVNAALTVAYNGAPATFPPPGFATSSVMRVIPRTWKRVAQ